MARPAAVAAPVAPVAVQVSKSYMDVSMSANRTSSSAKSERNPEDEEGEAEWEGAVSAKPEGVTAGTTSICRNSAWRLSTRKTAAAASGLTPMVLKSLTGGVSEGGAS